ncbi:MAG: GguC protein [Paracoccaceae bacterium]|nr:MAG: GguC protein [Paracoccaceae bacterium]
MSEPLLLIQTSADAGPRAGLLDGDAFRPAADGASVLDLAQRAIAAGTTLADTVAGTVWGAAQPVAGVAFLPPVTHPDPTHLHATGTGLTHLGSADARDRMHAATGAEVTDSIRMFRDGLAGGKPAAGGVGVQPEWFYKGNGHVMVPPGGDLPMPPFAEDGGEEPELAGIYLIGPDGTPHRLGFALANEFSDHVLERRNYLLLAHSKLRAFSVGPALRVGPLPDDIRGTSRVLRGGAELFASPFLTGEANMSHHIANLEHHHFKYDLFRRPGEVHVHMFGTACLSFAAGVRTEPGDLFEIAAPGFGPALVNRLVRTAGDAGVPMRVRSL